MHPRGHDGVADREAERLGDAGAELRGAVAAGEAEVPVVEQEACIADRTASRVAHAVDELHTQALLLAGDEARLRLLVNDMFETMSRRSRAAR